MSSRPSKFPVVLGGLAVGTFDLTFACTFWTVGFGATPMRVMQSVARGVLGKASFDGGVATAALGCVLHFLIAMAMAFTYYLVARRVPVLTRHAVACGAAYGLLLYAAMNFVVLPLSAVGMPSFANTLWVTLSVVTHVLFGVIIALSVRRAV